MNSYKIIYTIGKNSEQLFVVMDAEDPTTARDKAESYLKANIHGETFEIEAVTLDDRVQ